MRGITIIHHETHLESKPRDYNPHADTSGCTIGCGVVLIGAAAAIAFSIQPNLGLWGQRAREGVNSLLILGAIFFAIHLIEKVIERRKEAKKKKQSAKGLERAMRELEAAGLIKKKKTKSKPPYPSPQPEKRIKPPHDLKVETHIEYLARMIREGVDPSDWTGK